VKAAEQSGGKSVKEPQCGTSEERLTPSAERGKGIANTLGASWFNKKFQKRGRVSAGIPSSRKATNEKGKDEDEKDGGNVQRARIQRQIAAGIRDS